MKLPKKSKAAVAHTARRLAAAVGRLSSVYKRTRPTWRMRFTRSGLRIGVFARSDERGSAGSVHEIPRAYWHSIACEGQRLSFSQDSAASSLVVDFMDSDAAADALGRIRRRMLSNRPAVWTGRALMIAVAWLLMSSYLQVRRDQEQARTAAIAANSGAAVPSLPDVSGALQDYPALNGAAPAPTAMALPPPNEAVLGPATGPAPSSAAETNGTGLEAFGLKVDDPQPAAPIAAPPAASVAPDAVSLSGIPMESQGNGPGCDPNLAFKAPAR